MCHSTIHNDIKEKNLTGHLGRVIENGLILLKTGKKKDRIKPLSYLSYIGCIPKR
jgi:hypothetical protein